MRQVMARGVRRDLRRAMGDDGLAAIGEAQTNIEKLANSLAQAHSRIDGLVADLSKSRLFCQERWDSSSATHKRLGDGITTAHGVLTRGLWGRLVWLVTGR